MNVHISGLLIAEIVRMTSTVLLIFLYLTISMNCLAQGNANSFGSYHYLYKATRAACSNFRLDLAGKGNHMFQVKNSPTFNSYIKSIFEDAANNRLLRRFDTLKNETAFIDALEACYPGSQNKTNSYLFINNLERIQRGGELQALSIASLEVLAAAIPIGRVASAVAKLYSSTPLVLRYIEAATLSFMSEPLLKMGYKLLYREKTKELIISSTDNNLSPNEHKRILEKSFLRSIAKLEQSRKIVESQLAADTSANKQELTINLESINKQIQSYTTNLSKLN